MTIPAQKKSTPILFQALDRGLETTTRFCLFFSAIVLGLLVFSYVLEVVVRYFFNSPTSWTFDVGKALLIVSVMMALPEITRSKGNITIDVFLEMLSLKTGNRVKQVISIICFFVCIITAWICMGETIRQCQKGIETFWINPVPKWWISAVIPFGFALSSLHFLKIGIQRQEPT